jgi:uncharacterized sporulation protein YeaH/YhbH (DUF444 family)
MFAKCNNTVCYTTVVNVKKESDMTTKREKQLRDLTNKIARMAAHREAAIKTLVRVETSLPKLRRQLDRLRIAIFRATQVESPHHLDPIAAPAEIGDEPLPMPAEREAQDGRSQDNDVVLQNDAGTKGGAGDLDEHGGIPTFLRRGQAAQAAADAVLSETSRKLAALPDPKAPELKATRKIVEQQKREAELTGKRRKVPLCGQAAIDAIRKAT